MKAVLVILLVIVISYFPAIFLQKTFFFGDNYSLIGFEAGEVFTTESAIR